MADCLKPKIRPNYPRFASAQILVKVLEQDLTLLILAFIYKINESDKIYNMEFLDINSQTMNKYGFKLIALFIALVAFFIIANNLWSFEPLLLERSHRFPHGFFETMRNNYTWLSNHELIYRSDKGPEGNHCPAFACSNMKTYQQIPFQPLNHLLSERDSSLDTWQISQDRRFFLGLFRNSAVLIDLDNTKRWDVLGGYYHSEIYWLGDSRHWFHVYHGLNGMMLEWPHIHLYSIQDRKSVQAITNSAQNPFYSADTLALNSSAEKVVTFDPAGSSQQDHQKTDHCFIYQRSLKHLNAQSRKFSVRLPAIGCLRQAAFSSDNTTVAFLLYIEPHSTFIDVLQRWFPIVTAKRLPLYQIWTCKLNGTEMHLVGQLNEQSTSSSSNAEDLTSDTIEQLRWLPDGSHLSFIYDNSFFTVAAK